MQDIECRFACRVVVTQQPDGWWRWRFEAASSNAGPLVSGEAYPESDEALDSARQAYPGLFPLVEAPHTSRHRLRHLIRRAATAAVVGGVVIAAARSGNRGSGSAT